MFAKGLKRLLSAQPTSSLMEQPLRDLVVVSSQASDLAGNVMAATVSRILLVKIAERSVGFRPKL